MHLKKKKWVPLRTEPFFELIHLNAIHPARYVQGHPAPPGGTSVKFARFFYEIGRKQSGIIHSKVVAEGCAFIEMQRLSLIVRWWLTLPYVWISFSVDDSKHQSERV